MSETNDSNTNDLESVEPIKSLEQIEQETGGAAQPTTDADVHGEDRSFLGSLVAPFVSPGEDTRADRTTAPPSDTTENSSG